MGIDTHLFERFFLLHTELVLFVNDYKGEVFELRLEQCMGTYYHIDAPLFKAS